MKYLRQYGEHVQRSVFEFDIDEKTMTEIFSKTIKIIDKDKDRVRLWTMCEACRKKIDYIGQGPIYALEPVEII